jgi:MoaA/NifB/PqqE/SkfB family radical SAM enzyme
MIVGGEPTLVPHFAEVCKTLSDGGVLLKIETNGHNFDVNTLKGLGIRSVQISLDGASQAVYGRQRSTDAGQSDRGVPLHGRRGAAS